MKSKLSDQLLEKFADVSKIMHRSTSVNFPDLSFSIREIITITFIKRKRSVTINQIAQHLKITMPTATVLLDKLEKNNLISRNPSPIDKRSTLIKLTPKTLKLFYKLNKIRLERAKHFLSLISEEDKHTLSKILDKFLLNLKTSYEK
jgi:MarR family transcriptional regulator, transcriptional regulator for hemolysin